MWSIFFSLTTFTLTGQLSLCLSFKGTRGIEEHGSNLSKTDSILNDQCKQTKENSKMGKTRDLFKKV